MLRIRTDSRTRFVGLEMGQPLAAVTPAEIIESEDGLLVRLPTRVTRADNPPLRLFFSTALFSFATTFIGEVSDSEREVLPQPVIGGDAGQALSTNSLHVLGVADSAPSAVQELSVSTPVLTPTATASTIACRSATRFFACPNWCQLRWRSTPRRTQTGPH